MKNYLLEIKQDVLDIAKAINSIDENYRLFYNIKKARFELYAYRGLNLNLELVCPYNKLDNRFLLKVKQTRKENSDILIKQMEQNNLKIKKQTEQSLIDASQQKSKEMLDYADKKNQSADFSDAYSTQWF